MDVLKQKPFHLQRGIFELAVCCHLVLAIFHFVTACLSWLSHYEYDYQANFHMINYSRSI